MDLRAKAIDIRKDIVNLIYHAGTGHIGGDLSVTDILVDLYYKQMNVGPDKVQDPERDRFVLSKGHCVEALYTILADKGFFPKEELQTYSQYLSAIPITRLPASKSTAVPWVTAWRLASAWPWPQKWISALIGPTSS